MKNSIPHTPTPEPHNVELPELAKPVSMVKGERIIPGAGGKANQDWSFGYTAIMST